MTPERIAYWRDRVAASGDVVVPAGELLGLLCDLEAAGKRADDWMRYADRLRCPKCTHERGPIGTPKGLLEDGYRPVWVCPCDCHADVGALRESLAALLPVAACLLSNVRTAVQRGSLQWLSPQDEWRIKRVLAAAQAALTGSAPAE